MKSAILLVCALAPLASVVAIARADDYVPPAYLALPPTLPPSYAERSVWRLDLADALAVAMKQNLGVTLARKQLEIVRLGGVATVADQSEPTVSAGVSHGSSDSPPPTLQAGMPGSVITTGVDSWYLGLGQRLPTGATVGLTINSSRTSSSSGAAVEPLNTVAGVSLTVRQPLLRGFSLDLAIPQIAVLGASFANEAARHDVELKATGVVQQTEAAYWEVVAQLYAYSLARKNQQTAEDTVVLTQRQIAVGMSQPADLIGAKSALAHSKLAVLAAEASIDAASDGLRTVLDLPREDWQRPILPTERPRFEPAVVTSDEAALETAIKHRPDLAASELGLRSSELSVRAAQNGTLPDISLGVTASALGQDTSLGGALTQLRENTGWGVMLDVTWTPLGRASAARAKQARLQHQVTLATRDQLVQSIWAQVRGAIRDQRAAALAVSAASDARTLASESLDVETRRFALGASSNLTIATRQQELAEAELAELSALLHHQAAATGLLVATGRLLEHRHIELAVKP